MLIYCTADAEKDVSMKKLKSEEAITILKGMKVDIPVPKAAVTQIERNEAIEMAINALKCSEILNSSDTISRQAVIDALQDRYKLYSWDDGGAQKAENRSNHKRDL